MKTTVVSLILLALSLTATALPVLAADAPAPAQTTAATPQDQVRTSLDALIEAYSAKNVRQFMELVSERYTGDASELDSAVRRDFSRFTNINIRYTFNNVTSDGKDKVSSAITFTRDHTVIKTGKQAVVQKQTVLIFRKEDGAYKLLSQKGPRLFGKR